MVRYVKMYQFIGFIFCITGFISASDVGSSFGLSSSAWEDLIPAVLEESEKSVEHDVQPPHSPGAEARVLPASLLGLREEETEYSGGGADPNSGSQLSSLPSANYHISTPSGPGNRVSSWVDQSFGTETEAEVFETTVEEIRRDRRERREREERERHEHPGYLLYPGMIFTRHLPEDYEIEEPRLPVVPGEPVVARRRDSYRFLGLGPFSGLPGVREEREDDGSLLSDLSEKDETLPLLSEKDEVVSRPPAPELRLPGSPTGNVGSPMRGVDGVARRQRYMAALRSQAQEAEQNDFGGVGRSRGSDEAGLSDRDDSQRRRVPMPSTEKTDLE